MSKLRRCENVHIITSTFACFNKTCAIHVHESVHKSRHIFQSSYLRSPAPQSLRFLRLQLFDIPWTRVARLARPPAVLQHEPRVLLALLRVRPRLAQLVFVIAPGRSLGRRRRGPPKRPRVDPLRRRPLLPSDHRAPRVHAVRVDGVLVVNGPEQQAVAFPRLDRYVALLIKNTTSYNCPYGNKNKLVTSAHSLHFCPSAHVLSSGVIHSLSGNAVSPPSSTSER